MKTLYVKEMDAIDVFGVIPDCSTRLVVDDDGIRETAL